MYPTTYFCKKNFVVFPIFKKFFDAKLPGMDTQYGPLTDAVRLMASQNPDSSIKSLVGLQGGYDPCSNYADSNQGPMQYSVFEQKWTIYFVFF